MFPIVNMTKMAIRVLGTECADDTDLTLLRVLYCCAMVWMTRIPLHRPFVFVTQRFLSISIYDAIEELLII